MIIDAHPTDTVPSHEVRQRAQEALANAGEPMSEVTYDALRKRLTDAEAEIEKLRAMLQTARHNALKEARLVIADKSVPETPATFEDIMERDIEMMNAIRALGEKE
jgi:cysteinyl-tRNA synthetase